MKGFDKRWSRKKSQKNFFSCGDLRIYQIREIRGSNRIIYGDKYDNDSFTEIDINLNKSFKPTTSESEYGCAVFDPIYAEINSEPEIKPSRSCECLSLHPCDVFDNLRRSNLQSYKSWLRRNDCSHFYEKLYHFSSHPSLKSESCDSGFRSLLVQVKSLFIIPKSIVLEPNQLKKNKKNKNKQNETTCTLEGNQGRKNKKIKIKSPIH